ncbi:MAG: alkylmercury lyase family protein [Proteobacteria bacterium]|nr:alkylmercury lyase family protein [Pseudomonadota bacterium]
MMGETEVSKVLSRLGALLPLSSRIASLTDQQRQCYQSVCYGLLARAIPIILEGPALEDVQQLAELDLVVLDSENEQVLGAYPVTTEVTPHHLGIGSRDLYAMCAFDAVSIAPLLKQRVEIESVCAVSKDVVSLVQEGSRVLACSSDDLHIGIGWQDTNACAAHSLCRDMVFLASRELAEQWQQGRTASILTLAQAIEAGSQFFAPVLEPIHARLASRSI